MNTHRIVIELKWDRRAALTLALAVTVPLLAVGGLLTALAARPSLPSVAAGAPSTLSYQGQVKVNGQPFSGVGHFKFALISSDGLTGLWTNDGTGLGAAPFQPASAVNLTVTAGLFNVLLGDTSLPGMTRPITSSVFVQPNRALRVWFNDGVNGIQQLAPDVALAAVPYALNSQTLSGLDASAFARRSPTTQQIALLKWYTAINTTQSDFPVGNTPNGVAFDGANLWVVNSDIFNPSTISVLRASDGFHIMTPTVGFGASSIAFDGANMWVTNNNDGTVSVLRASDGSPVMTPNVGSHPLGIAFDGTNMWVANAQDGNVSVLRARDGVHVMTPTVGAFPSGMAFDGANMWVANNVGGTVSVLRASDGFNVMTPTVGSLPNGVAFDGANLWVANWNDGTASVLRASDGFNVMTPTVGVHPYGVAFDGANLWVANIGSGTVSVLRASDGAHIATATVPGGPVDIAFDGAFMWVTNGNSVSKR